MSLTVLYADAGLEFPPLQAAALQLLRDVEARGFQTRIVRPPLDHRFFVYMLGRGVPPPTNHFRFLSEEQELAELPDLPW